MLDINSEFVRRLKMESGEQVSLIYSREYVGDQKSFEGNLVCLRLNQENRNLLRVSIKFEPRD